MTLIISLILAGAFVLLCGKSLKKHPWIYYGIALLIAAAVCGCTYGGVSFPRWFTLHVWPLFAQGGLAAGFFLFVMYAGAMPNGSKAIRKLMPIRGELSIMACILTFGHNIAYGKTYFVGMASLPWYQKAAARCSILMILILIPLFITSFPAVRKKMKAKKWKRLQRMAYGFYALLYVHIMFLTVPQALRGRSGYGLTIGAYTAVFAGYLLCRVAKAWAVKHKTTEKLAGQHRALAFCALAVAAVFSLGLTCSSGTSASAASEAADTITAAVYEPTAEPDPNPPVPTPTPVPVIVEEIEPAAVTEAWEDWEPDASSEIAEESETDGSAQITEETVEEEPETESEEETQEEAAEGVIYRNGTYFGEAFAYTDYVDVSVTVEGDVITDITVVGYWDDEEYYDQAVSVIDDILRMQSTDVDAATGATYSSKGIISAVNDALESALIS